MTAIDALEPRRLLAFSPIQLGERAYESGFETAVDSAGNTIVAGLFQHTVDFNPNGAAVKRTALGETDIYIAKYDPAGALLWVGQVGGEETDQDSQLPIDPARAGRFINRVGIQPDFLGEHVNAIALDTSGNIFLGGTFYHTADFDPTSGVLELTANPEYGLYDAYLLKIDPNGGLVWAKNFGGQFNDVINGIAIDPAGNPVVTGYFTRRADFDPGPAEFNVDALGRDDIFVAKYTAAAGKFVWVKTFGGEETDLGSRDAGNGIAIDSGGNIVVTGTFAGKKVDFDPGPAQFLLRAEKLTDMFLLELSPPGKRVFAEAFAGDDYGGGVKVVAQNGAIYTAGYFSGEVDADPGTAERLLISAGDDRHTDLLVSKFKPDGALIWAKQMGGEEYETIGGFGVGADDSVYLSGGFNDTADFDPGPGTFNLQSIEGDDDFDDSNDSGRDFSYDIYVSRLSTNGKFLAATRIGSSGDDFGAGLAVTSTGITLTGQFRNTVAFDGTGNKRKSAGAEDAFLIQLSEGLKLLTA